MTSQPRTPDRSTLGNQSQAGMLLTAAQLLERYASGERRFRQVQLKKVDLKGANLAQIELRGADLSNANLREADLSNADLRDACLDGADLYNANLSRANLQGARLAKANLKEANLTRASLEQVHLEGAFLTKASMIRASLKEANLIGAHLNEANLGSANLSNAYLDGAYLIQTSLLKANLAEASVMGAFLSGAALSGANFNGAYYTDKTNFDASFDPVSAGLRKIQNRSIEELLNAFKYLNDGANRYCGSKMTARYWESSRPDFEWLQQFQVNASGKITFSGNTTEPLTSVKLRYCQKWLDTFIDSCSKIIQEFPTLLDSSQIEFYPSKRDGDQLPVTNDQLFDFEL